MLRFSNFWGMHLERRREDWCAYHKSPSCTSCIPVDGGEKNASFIRRGIFRRQYVGLRTAKQQTPNAKKRPQSARSKGLTGFTLLFLYCKPLFSMQTCMRRHWHRVAICTVYFYKSRAVHLFFYLCNSAFLPMHTVNVHKFRVISIKFTLIVRRLYWIPVILIL